FSSLDNANHRSVGDGAITVARRSEHYGPKQSLRACNEVFMRLFSLGHFVEAKGHRGFAFENGHKNYELTRFNFDFGNRSRQGFEWTFLDCDGVANLVVHGYLR